MAAPSDLTLKTLNGKYSLVGVLILASRSLFYVLNMACEDYMPRPLGGDNLHTY